RLPQHLFIEEQQGAERLAMRRYGDLSLRRQHGEKRFHLGAPHLARMAQAVEANEEAGPVDVVLLPSSGCSEGSANAHATGRGGGWLATEGAESVCGLWRSFHDCSSEQYPARTKELKGLG